MYITYFLTVKNILHERHECPEPTRSVENHIQMRYVSLRVLRMCHEWHSQRIVAMCKPSKRSHVYDPILLIDL